MNKLLALCTGLFCIPFVHAASADDEAADDGTVLRLTDRSSVLISSRSIQALPSELAEKWLGAHGLMTFKEPGRLSEHIKKHNLHNKCYFFHNAQTDPKPSDVGTLLELAIMYGLSESIETILASGASPTDTYQISYETQETSVKIARRQAIYLAMWYGKVPAFKQLYPKSRGALFAKTEHDDRTNLITTFKNFHFSNKGTLAIDVPPTDILPIDVLHRMQEFAQKDETFPATQEQVEQMLEYAQTIDKQSLSSSGSASSCIVQ